MNDYETHNVCNKRLKEEGGKAKCCECNPHEGCEFDEMPDIEKAVDKVVEEYGDTLKMLGNETNKTWEEEYKRDCSHNEMLCWKECAECGEFMLRKEFPEGVNQWIERGEKYGYLDYILDSTTRRIDNEISKLLHESANTKLGERDGGWKVLLKLREFIKTL